MATLYQYHGKIDLIIADPPYNTGKDFRYNDKWDQDPNDPGLGDYVKADDPSRHTKWMKFMLPRIQMIKQMLKSNGVLAFCIDERELFRLGMILDEVFGESNRIAIINWQKLGGPKTYTHVSPATEYILVYSKNLEKTETGLMPRSDNYLKQFKNPDKDPRGPWIVGDSGSQTPTFSMVYAIQNPFTGNLCEPPTGSHWRFAKSRMKEFLEGWGSEYEAADIKDGKSPALLIKNFSIANLKNPLQDPTIQASSKKAYEILEKGPWSKIIFSHGDKGKPQQKRYLNDMKEGHIPITYWGKENYENPIELGVVSWENKQSGTTSKASKEISETVGKGHGFETAKPLKLFTKIIQLWCSPNGLILDPFAGSGTTGEAVLQLNKEAEANRSFILIEQGNTENGDDYCRTLLQKRLQAAITGKWADQKEHESLGGGFKFTTLDKQINNQAILQMERTELIDTIIASRIDKYQQKYQGLQVLKDQKYNYLIAKNANNEGFFLVWNGPNQNANFTKEVYEKIVQEAQENDLKTPYHVYARLYLCQVDTVNFYQIPDSILLDFGFDLEKDRFN
ncbi:site-specific DNA-methyltransferase [endosymbiont GvMRE of Glomus versiforme]|uniref:site-specific DNA-methyltransferase n=1 Tax=endosymbiont GvMRE of Glomus versiforme TaxID=2039283 RepID=UPI000EDB99E7|nr:site-specific DNA-methyltransferase [endosymbiont GvMRE of Glomus versiforme]RHZ37533.1 DNA methyltransferase [endosymbiont GvMRE of Glomus versiforme]